MSARDGRYNAAMAEIDRLRALSNIDGELVVVEPKWCLTHRQPTHPRTHWFDKCITGRSTADCELVDLFYRTPKETQ